MEKPIYRFGPFALDTRTYELRDGDRLVAVEPQVFSVLSHLIAHRDQVVSKDDLIANVWGGRIVSDATLASRINAARRALGDTGQAQRFIKTVTRRGFRFVPEVTIDTGIAAPRAGESNQAGGTPPATQVIRYARTPDATQIAYATSGQGPALIKAANWLNHLEYDWQSPVWRDLFTALSAGHRLIRYDGRGVGLSDPVGSGLSFKTFLDDFESVVAAAGLKSTAILGISQGAAVAIDFAARHPKAVSKLVLWGGFARGRRRRGSAEDTSQSEALVTLMRQGWGNESSAFRRMFAALYLPEASDEQVRWWIDLQRIATSAETAIRMRTVVDDIDVSDQLARIRAPTLILHSSGDSVAPIAEARLMAAEIRNARFVLLDSANHMVLPQEPAWARAVHEIKAFLAETGG